MRYIRRDDPRESSRAEGCVSLKCSHYLSQVCLTNCCRPSSRRDPPSRRPRRDSVISSGSVDPKSAGRHQTQGRPSSKREGSRRPDDGGKRAERSEATYISDNRRHVQQDDQPAAYGERQSQISEEYGSQPAYAATNLRDSADEIAGGMQSLSVAPDYPPEVVASSAPTSSDFTEATTSYGAFDTATTDYGQTQPPSSFRGAVPGSRNIRGTPGDTEKLDKQYQMRNHDYKKFFRIGRVFATLWTEGVSHNFYDKNQTFISEVIYNERVHSKIRRFVVVRQGDRSVTCLPVTSYEGYGHKKPGIRLGDHGFIHSRKAPEKVDHMLPKSLKVILSKGAVDIKDPSLVNYGKVYTVETNVKVKNIGDLDDDSKALLVRYFHRVFVEESDLSGMIDDTPRQKNAVLAHVGGAAYDLPPPSGYNVAPLSPGYAPSGSYSASASQGAASGYPPNPSGYGAGPSTQPSRFEPAPYQSTDPPAMYASGSDMQMSRAGGHPSYPSQPGTGYLAAGMGSGYPSTTGYGSAPTMGARYNTTPSYYSPTPPYTSSDPRYSNVTTASTSQYPAVSYTPRHTDPYLPEHATPADAFRQPSGAHTTSGGGDYYQGATGQAYYDPVVLERDENISLPTLEEEQEQARRRREANAGTSRERDRRHRR